MSDIDRESVLSLLQEIETRLRRLGALSGATYEQYAKDVAVRDQVERNLEVAIQCCIDLGNHVLASISEKTPRTYREIFVLLAQHGVIPEGLAESLANMAGFRNVLVHAYLALDHRRVYGYLARMDDIRRFARAIADYLETRGLLRNG